MLNVMSWFSQMKYTALVCVWLFLISALTVIKVAPENLNADILINSVMSLQKLTLYYWGQNRLLNVLPLSVSFIRNPSLNLAAILILSSISFYGLLYFISRAAAMLVGSNREKEVAFKVFVIISSTFILIFTPHAISEITIGHIEYSFPSFLLVISVLILFPKQDRIRSWRSWFISLSAIVLAIGMNPSTLIPAFFITLVAVYYKKKLQLTEIIFLITSGLAFILWDFISKRYGSLPYNEFKLEIFFSGFKRIVENILGAINLPILLGFIFLNSIGRVGFLARKNNDSLDSQSLVSYITNATIVFSIGWFFLFAGSRWVEMNAFSWRYFIYILFALIFLGAVYLTQLLNQLSTYKSLFILGFAVLVAVQFMFQSNMKMNFNNYKIFQRVDEMTDAGEHLYSGDYWIVWPSVLRDMMNGYESYGLAYRGGANKKVVKAYFLKRIKENGHASIYCLNDTVQNCISLITSLVGPIYVVGSKQLKEGVQLISVIEESK